MLSALTSIFSLLSSWGLLLVANSLLSTLLALRADLESFSTATIGIIAAAYFLGLFAGAMYGDRLINLVGHIRAYGVYASFTSVAALLHIMVIDPVAWIMIRGLAGFCMAALVMITESWLNARATNTTRGQILSLYMVTNYLAAGIGQLLIPVADPDSFALFAIASISYSVALVPVLLTRLIAPEVKPRARVKLMSIFRISPVGMIGSAVAGLSGAAIYGLGPLFTRGIGKSTTVTAIFMALIIFGGMLLQWPLGKLSDKMDRRRVLVGVSAASSAAALCIVFSADAPLWMLYAAAVLFGSFAFIGYPIAAAHMNDSAPPEDMMHVAAGLLTAYGVGAVAGPLISANFMEWTSPKALFYYLAVVFFAYMVFVLSRMRVSKAPMRKHRRMWISRSMEQLHHNRVSESEMRDEQDRDIARLIGGVRNR